MPALSRNLFLSSERKKIRSGARARGNFYLENFNLENVSGMRSIVARVSRIRTVAKYVALFMTFCDARGCPSSREKRAPPLPSPPPSCRYQSARYLFAIALIFASHVTKLRRGVARVTRRDKMSSDLSLKLNDGKKNEKTTAVTREIGKNCEGGEFSSKIQINL